MHFFSVNLARHLLCVMVLPTTAAQDTQPSCIYSYDSPEHWDQRCAGSVGSQEAFRRKTGFGLCSACVHCIVHLLCFN